MACEKQLGPLSQPCLQKKDDTFRTNVRNSSSRRVDHLLSWEGGSRITERQKDRRAAVLTVSSEQIQGKNDLINRKNLERFSGNPVPDDLKRPTQALREAALRGKGDRETPHSEGTGTKAKIGTIPFPGDNCRSFLYRETATIGAAADVGVLNRDNITRNDDVEQSLKDLIIRSQPRFREECGLRQNKSGVSQVANARVQSRSDIAEKGYGSNPEDSILCASPHINEKWAVTTRIKTTKRRRSLAPKTRKKPATWKNR